MAGATSAPRDFVECVSSWAGLVGSAPELPQLGWTGLSRRVTIQVQNVTDSLCSFSFGGEWFESGGWKDVEGTRDMRIEEHATLEFESKVFLQGVAGYVFYRNTDHSQTLLLAFSCPVTTAPRFTARAGSTLPDCQAVWDGVPELARPGANLRRSDGCAWETLELSDEHVVVRCVVLSSDGDTQGISEEFSRRLMKARWCPSTIRELQAPELPFPCPVPIMASRSISSIEDTPGRCTVTRKAVKSDLTPVERHFVVTVENRSDETFLHDGDWFDAGRWTTKLAPRIPPQGRVKLEFSSADFFSGLSGLAWYVNEGGLNTYFSIVFSNPLAGQGKFGAWAGAPPEDLLKELSSATALGSQQGVQVLPERGCAWNVIERGAVISVRLVIPDTLSAMDPQAFPSKPPVTAGIPSTQKSNKAKANTATPVAIPVTSTNVARFEIPEPEPESAIPEAFEDEQMSSSLERFLTTHIVPRPRDALDGVGSGLKAAGGGILVGSVALVALPFVGAREDGISGFGYGLAKGACIGVACAAGGIVAGATQVARGVYNTPEAIQQAHAGKRWDTDTGAWVDDCSDLRAEALIAGEESEEEEEDDDEDEMIEGGERRERRVVDTAYYDIIGVPTGATSNEIKK